MRYCLLAEILTKWRWNLPGSTTIVTARTIMRWGRSWGGIWGRWTGCWRSCCRRGCDRGARGACADCRWRCVDGWGWSVALITPRSGWVRVVRLRCPGGDECSSQKDREENVLAIHSNWSRAARSISRSARCYYKLQSLEGLWPPPLLYYLERMNLVPSCFQCLRKCGTLINQWWSAIPRRLHEAIHIFTTP